MLSIPWWLIPFCTHLLVILTALWTSAQDRCMAPELMAAIVFMIGTLIMVPIWIFFFTYYLLS